MKPFRVFLLAWGLAGLGAVAGSILGNAAGRPGLFAGAVAGGVLGVTAAVVLAVRVSWLPAETRMGGWLGGVAGFALAAPIAVTHLDTPIARIRLRVGRRRRAPRRGGRAAAGGTALSPSAVTE